MQEQPMRAVSAADAMQTLTDRRHEERRRVAAADFPIYGLPPLWGGARVLSGVAWESTIELTQVGLTHVEPPGTFYDESGPRLIVTTTIEASRSDRVMVGVGEGATARVRADLARDLRDVLGLAAFPDDPQLAPEERRAWLRDPDRVLRSVGEPDVGDATISVDGAHVSFALLALGEGWSAAAQLGEQKAERHRYVRVLRLQGLRWPIRGVADRGLVPIVDMTPYLAGQDALWNLR